MPQPSGVLVGAILLGALIGGTVGAGTVAVLDHNETLDSSSTSTSTSGGQAIVSVADLYANLRPSVVEITAIASRTGQGGTGSGLVLDTNGHIVTNYHVVQDADQFDVALSDGSTASAQVVGIDPGDDLAIIKIDPANLQLTPVKLATSDIRVGDAVVAIGNPLALEASLTEGVVSGLGRTLSDGTGRPLRELIQTDTAINPGNSGGGLFNLNGELIGITNAIENPSGQDAFSGIGYAIPVSTLQKYLPDMLAGKTISHARLGISLVDVTPALVREYGLSVSNGVMVGQVEPSSAASRAGLQGATSSRPGDIILSIDGQPVSTFEDLAGYLDGKNPGDTVSLHINRDGKEMGLTLTLDAWTAS